MQITVKSRGGTIARLLCLFLATSCATAERVGPARSTSARIAMQLGQSAVGSRILLRGWFALPGGARVEMGETNIQPTAAGTLTAQVELELGSCLQRAAPVQGLLGCPVRIDALLFGPSGALADSSTLGPFGAEPGGVVTVAAGSGPTLRLVDSVALSALPSTLSSGDSVQGTALLYGRTGNVLSGRTVQWRSSAPTVLVARPNGQLVAVSAGSAQISAVAAEDTTKRATRLIEVLPTGGVLVNFDDLPESFGNGPSLPNPYQGRTWAAGASFGWVTEGAPNFLGVVCRSARNCAFNGQGAANTVSATTPFVATLYLREFNFATNGSTSAASVAIEGLVGGVPVFRRDVVPSASYVRVDIPEPMTSLRLTPSSSGYFLIDDITFTPATLRPVASVQVSLPGSTLAVGQSAQATAVGRDAGSSPLPGRTISSWTSSAPAVASVSTAGVVTALSSGTTQISATIEGVTGSVTLNVAAASSASAVTAGQAHTCALASTGTAFCWGDNRFGQLGDGSTTNRLSPVAVAGGHRFTSLSAGLNHTCGVTTTGSALCWGRNFSGQLGDGTTTDRSTPTPVSGGIAFAGVSAGSSHTCARSTLGLVYCWGLNNVGQLGNGTTAGASSPVPVTTTTEFADVSAGGDYSCARTGGGSVFCWGSNRVGAFSNGSATGSPNTTPASVGLSAELVSTGFEHSCFIIADGAGNNRLACSGSNNRGQLGDSTQVNRSRNVLIAREREVGEVRTVYAGIENTCAITVAGGIWCWGEGSFGTLGVGLTSPGPRPFPSVPVAGGRSYATMALGLRQACGVTTSGELFCWGRNDFGQVGDGTTTTRDVPVRIALPQ